MTKIMKRNNCFYKYLTIIITLLLLLSSYSKADTSDYISARITDNILNIGLTNTTTFCAFQMDVQLPNGVSETKVEPVAERLGQNGSATELGDTKFIIDKKNLPCGILRITAYNLANAAITLNDGPLLKITLDKIPNEPTSLTVSDIEFVTRENICSTSLSDLSAENGSGIGYTVSMSSFTQSLINTLPNGTTLDLSNTEEFDGTNTNTFNIIYKRQVSDKGIKWGSICMPNSISSTEDLQLYTVTAINDNTVTITAKEELEAGEPGIYNLKKEGDLIIKASGQLKLPQAGTWLVGVMKQTNVTEANTFYLKDNQFKSINDNFNISAFKAYLKGSPATAKSSTLDISEDGITDVDIVTDNNTITTEGIYNLQGSAQRILHKGLNILKLSDGNARKVLIR